MTNNISSEEQLGLVEKAKEYISDTRYRIKLHDLAIQKCREVITLASDEHFPVETRNVTAEEVADRLKRYATITQDLQDIYTVLCHWGTSEHVPIIQKIITRLIERDGPRKGTVAWLGLRYYPSVLLLYAGGIGAIAAQNYENLAAIFTARVGSSYTNGKSEEAVLEIGHALAELEDVKLFKLLPDHTRHYVPRSEYLFKLLQPRLDDLLFLGRGYEDMFDRFEVMLALVHADLMFQSANHISGPLGRFAWKHRSGEFSVYSSVVKEAQAQKQVWPPLRAGLFGGSFERFSEIAAEYEQLINGLGWF
jgi:hypothetical protein